MDERPYRISDYSNRVIVAEELLSVGQQGQLRGHPGKKNWQ